MSRLWMVLAIGACAQAGPADRVGDSGTTIDAPGHVTDAPPHGDGSGSGSGSGSGGGCSFSGALARWDLTGQTGSESSVVAASTATGVTAGSLTRAAALTAQSGAGSINGSNWPTAGALDATKYYAFTLTAPTGCSMTLTSVAIDLKASATGPANGALATSKDSFVATTPVGTAAPSTPTVTASASGQLEIRVYGYSASATGGTLRVQNTLSVNGTIQ
ncbi:MAG TPA: hypothetical protein VFQ65_14625 [Kofleriaceae bacterium]|nr:hypothetical protein [Kofleriaceae bacterium]